MLKILVNAYACCPGMGSEQGMAWNWCTSLAKHCELHIITESEYKNKVLAAVGQLPQGGNIHFYFNTIGGSEEAAAAIRKKCWKQGTWSFYFDYAKWQDDALKTACDIISKEHIDIVHQLNMVGFREPGNLWKIDNKPLIWGPIAGIGSIPFAFMKDGGLKFVAFYMLKNFITSCQLRWKARVRKMARRADTIIAATPTAQKMVEMIYDKDVMLIPETGCKTAMEDNAGTHDFLDRSKFRIIWVGRFLYTKRLDIALQTIDQLRHINGLEFHIVGQGANDSENKKYRRMADELHLDDICHWHGQIPNDEVNKMMMTADVFFFSSIFEATSTVVLEAIQNNLPIVCFDTCGMGYVVNEDVGRKIAMTNPCEAVKDFAHVLNHLNEHREKLVEMSKHCTQRAHELSWESKAQRMVEIYETKIRGLLHLLWPCDDAEARRAIDTMVSVTPMTVRLHIIGDVEKDKWLRYAENLGVADYIDWHDKTTTTQVRKMLDGKRVVEYEDILKAVPQNDSYKSEVIADTVNYLYRH